MQKLKAYKILCWTIPIIFLPIVFVRDGTFELQLHDNYFVFYHLDLVISSSLILGVLGGCYWLLRSYKLNHFLSLLHAILTSLSLVGVSIIAILQTIYGPNNFELFQTLQSAGLFLFITLLVVQILFLLNVIFGILKGKG